MSRKLPRSTVFGTTTIQGLFAAIFPSDCRVCGTPLLNVSRLPVCEECIAAVRPIAGETCDLCGEILPMIAGNGEFFACSACQEMVPLFDRAVAYGSYEGELRELVHLLKYEYVLPAAHALGRMLALAITKLELNDSLLVVPVPLHASRRRQRRFNQAELIARAAINSLHDGIFEISAKTLVRVRPTISQIGLTRPQRRENMRGAFKVAHPSKVSGRNIVLVDDVLTTGTTASECARVLKKSGAEKVWVATVARTLKNIQQQSGDFTQIERAS